MATKGVQISNSGLDMDELIKNSVTSYQNKYNKAYKAKVVQEWTKSAYVDLYTSMKSYKENDLFNYKLPSKTTARVASSTNTDSVTATANMDALQMTHDVKVNAVAKNAYLQTINGKKASEITPGANGTTSTNLATLSGVDLSGYDAMTETQQESTALSYTISDGKDSKTISYTYKELKNGKTLNDFAADIKNAGLNLAATYDSTNDSFSIYNKSTGAANTIKIEGTNAESTALLSQLSLGKYTDALTAITTDALKDGIAGTDASITVDGKTTTGESNNITIAGVTYTAKEVSTTTAKVSISTDVDSLVETVQNFVDSYNEMLSKMTTKTHETKYSAYGALTDDEKSAMSDDQVKEWEKKAKSGLLRNDSILSDVVDNMRTALSTPIDGLTGTYKSASSIGIAATGSYTDKEYGKLHLDEEKLRKAIAEDPDIVYKIFGTANSDTTDANGVALTEKEKANKQGVAVRLSDIFKSGVESVKTKAGTTADTDDVSTLGVKITTMETNLKQLLATLQEKENYYYKRYSAMESAIGNLQNSLSSITGALG